MCDAYHYPHRMGSGRCGNREAQETFAHGPLPPDADARAAAPLTGPVATDDGDSFAAWLDSNLSAAE